VAATLIVAIKQTVYLHCG